MASPGTHFTVQVCSPETLTRGRVSKRNPWRHTSTRPPSRFGSTSPSTFLPLSSAPWWPRPPTTGAASGSPSRSASQEAWARSSCPELRLGRLPRTLQPASPMRPDQPHAGFVMMMLGWLTRCGRFVLPGGAVGGVQDGDWQPDRAAGRFVCRRLTCWGGRRASSSWGGGPSLAPD